MNDLKARGHVINATIAAQIIQHHLHEIRLTNYARNAMKQKIRNLMPDLLDFEKQFDVFDQINEATTTEVYNIKNKYIETVAKVSIEHQPNIMAIIEAYYKAPEKLNDVVNQINHG